MDKFYCLVCLVVLFSRHFLLLEYKHKHPASSENIESFIDLLSFVQLDSLYREFLSCSKCLQNIIN